MVRLAPGVSRILRLPVAVVAIIALPTAAALWPFLTGAPGMALAKLWGNPYEMSNAIAIGSILAIISLAISLSSRLIFFPLVLVIALIMTAGPAAVLVGGLSTFAVLAVGYQFISHAAITKAARFPAAQAAIAFWVGKAVYFFCLALISGIPINTRLTHGLIMFAMLALCRRGAREALAGIKATVLNRTAAPGWLNIFIRFLVSLSVLILIFATIHPDIDGDAMTVHMRIAREMLIKGMWGYDVDEYVFSVMALGPQLNFSALFLIGGIEAVKVDLLVQFLTILTLVACGANSRPSHIGLAVAAVFATLPMFIREIAGLFVEVTLCGFSLAAVTLITAAARRRSRELVLLALLCAAGAVSSKLHGVFLAAPLVILAIPLWFLSPSYTARRLPMSLAIVGLGFGLAVFFYIFAWWKTGNPVFPFMNGVFHSSQWYLENFADRRWTGHISWDMPWRMTFESDLFEESSNGSLGLAIIFLTLGGFGLAYLPKKAWITTIPFSIGFIYLIGVGSQTQYLRYMLPGFLMIGMGLVSILHWSFDRTHPVLWFPAILALLVANVVGMPADRFRNGLLHIPALNYLQAGQFRGLPSLNFQEETLNGHKYVSNFINASSREVPTVLMLGCPYGAYINGRTIYTTWHNYSWHSIEQRLKNEVEFNRYLDTHRVSHVVIDPCTSPEKLKVFLPMILARYELVSELWGIQLYRIRTISGSAVTPVQILPEPQHFGKTWMKAAKCAIDCVVNN